MSNKQSIENTLVDCKTCGEKIAFSSEKCPKCGAARSIYDRGFQLKMWIPILILVIGFIITIGVGFSGEDGWQLGIAMIVGGAFWLYRMAKKAGL